MRRIRFRNAFFRGWFAARAQRRPPVCDSSSELAYVERGFKAGVDSGGRALPMIGHHRAPPLPDLPSEPAARKTKASANKNWPSQAGADPPTGERLEPVLVDFELHANGDEVPLLSDRAIASVATEDDVPVLTETDDEEIDGPALKQKPRSASRFFQD